MVHFLESISLISNKKKHLKKTQYCNESSTCSVKDLPGRASQLEKVNNALCIILGGGLHFIMLGLYARKVFFFFY